MDHDFNGDEKSLQGSNEDLDWLAFCYTVDELDESGRVEFEQKLDQDQNARRAVADAVLIQQLVHAATEKSRQQSVAVVSKSKVSIWNSQLHVSLITACSAAILILVGLMVFQNQTEPPASAAMGEELSQAVAYAELYDVEAAVVTSEFSPEFLFEDEKELVNNQSDVDQFDDESEWVEEPSEWMYVALTDMEFEEAME
ncbi:MAG: hypothetical protein AAF939_11635 [Planctomycetota bacterium]